jgi:hypothetical protein
MLSTPVMIFYGDETVAAGLEGAISGEKAASNFLLC